MAARIQPELNRPQFESGQLESGQDSIWRRDPAISQELTKRLHAPLSNLFRRAQQHGHLRLVDFAEAFESFALTPQDIDFIYAQLQLQRVRVEFRAFDVAPPADPELWENDPEPTRTASPDLYLDQLGRMPLLAPAQELYLAKELNERRSAWWRDLLSSGFAQRALLERLSRVAEEGRRLRDLIANTDSVSSETILARVRATVDQVQNLIDANYKDHRRSRHLPQHPEWPLPERIRIERRSHFIAEQLLRLDLQVDVLDKLRKDYLAAVADQTREPARRTSAQLIFESQSHETQFLAAQRARRIEATFERALQAKNRLFSGNVRLVAFVARSYRQRGVPYLDLIQEGNTGLMRAIDRFDYRKGYKLTTYATWWIRQAISRALADQGRSLRIPYHVYELLCRVWSFTRRWVSVHGREPRIDEISRELEVPVEEIRLALNANRTPLYLGSPLAPDEGDSVDSILPDDRAASPYQTTVRNHFREDLAKVLNTLNRRERDVLQLHFGLNGRPPITLEEIGRRMKVSRERIRQIEQAALSKLRGPLRAKPLLELLDDSFPAD